MAEKSKNGISRSNPLGTTRRVIWYALRTVLVISCILALCYGVFTEAMYVSNIYIVATEGMALRAEAILREGSISDLEQYFTEEQLNSDYMLYSDTYRGWTVENYDYRFSIERIRVWPWSRTGSMVYVERIPTITGSPESETDPTGGVPQWTAVRWGVALTKVEGRWLISGLTVIDEDPEEEPLPTPDYSRLESGAPTH